MNSEIKQLFSSTLRSLLSCLPALVTPQRDVEPRVGPTETSRQWPAFPSAAVCLFTAIVTSIKERRADGFPFAAASSCAGQWRISREISPRFAPLPPLSAAFRSALTWRLVKFLLWPVFYEK